MNQPREECCNCKVEIYEDEFYYNLALCQMNDELRISDNYDCQGIYCVACGEQLKVVNKTTDKEAILKAQKTINHA